MNNDNKVLACVDQSSFANNVANYAAWAARRMQIPLEFLHVIDRHLEKGSGDDHSGAIGIDAQENLLNKLAAKDEAHSKSTREQGRALLSQLREQATRAGATQVDVRQRHGELADTLAEQEASMALLVLGRQGETTTDNPHKLGGSVEHVVRALHKPTLVVPETFKEPQRVMIAFDGSTVTRRGVEMLATDSLFHELFRGLSITLLMSGKEKPNANKQLDWAKTMLLTAGFEVTALLIPGDTETVIAVTIKEQNIDLLMMGAFSHSSLRSLLFGSKTADLLRTVMIPTLLLR